MNRKDRRAQAARDRRKAWAAGQKSAQTGTLSPEYFQQIEALAGLASEWVAAQPTPPDLRWVEQKNDGVIVTGALDVTAHYLADSPDAFRLLAWVDERSGRTASLFQMTWALRLLRALPMPDGSYHGVTTTQQSKAMAWAAGFAASVAQKTPQNVIRETHCGHCGAPADGVHSQSGHAPKPGDVSLCAYCAGFNEFGPDLQFIAIADAEVEARIGPDDWKTTSEMRDIVRSTVTRMHLDKLGKKARPEA